MLSRAKIWGGVVVAAVAGTGTAMLVISLIRDPEATGSSPESDKRYQEHPTSLVRKPESVPLAPEHQNNSGSPPSADLHSQSALEMEWNRKSTAARLKWSADLQHESTLDAESLRFLLKRISDKSVNETTRNNLANILVRYPKLGEALCHELTKAIKDEGESFTWRNYALQHLASLPSGSANESEIVRVLDEVAKSQDPRLSGTALLVAIRRQEYLGVHQAGDFDERLLGALRDERVDSLTKIAILGLIGENNVTTALPVVRSLLADGENATTRVVIGTLGIIGSAEDVPRIFNYLAHPNRLIRMAAHSAIEKINLREKSDF